MKGLVFAKLVVHLIIRFDYVERRRVTGANLHESFSDWITVLGHVVNEINKALKNADCTEVHHANPQRLIRSVKIV
jgi:hypothetical protein